MKFAPAKGTHRARVHDALAGKHVDVGKLRDAEGDVARRYYEGVGAFRDHDGTKALALLRDSSRRLRGLGLVVAPLACDDQQATEALHVAWTLRGERRLLRTMRKQGRAVAIDAFLDALATTGQLRDLVDDLAFGSELAVRRHLAHALERPTQRFWSGLAYGHPAILGELLVARWQGHVSEADPVTRQLTAAHHERIAMLAPDAGLALARILLARGIDLGHGTWRELLRRRTADTVELAITQRERVPHGVLRSRMHDLPPSVLADAVRRAPRLLDWSRDHVRTLTPDRQQALADAWLEEHDHIPAYGTALFEYLPASPARDVAFERWSRASRDANGIVAASALRQLPVELAAREAARHVDTVVALQIDGLRRIQGIARYLPWDAAHAAVTDQLGHPEGGNRGLALAELLANPGIYLDDATLPARALALVTARKFEQDPIRLTMFASLSQWPRRIWRAEHLPAVAQALRDGLDAADLSGGTARMMEATVVRLFGVDPAWAGTWLVTLIKERGTIHDPNLGAKLSDADLRAAAPQLLAIAKTWSTSERTPWLVALASGLGSRLPLVEGLAELLVKVRDIAPYEWTAMSVTSVLSRYAPALHGKTLASTVARYLSKHWYGALNLIANEWGLRGKATSPDRHRRQPVPPAVVTDALVDVAKLLDPRYSPTAIATLKARAPEAYDAAFGALVKGDASIVALGDVSKWLDRHRQDLLGPYVSGHPIRGQWATGKTAWLVPFGQGYFRWLPAHVMEYAALLGRIVDDKERDTPSVFAALTIWPRLEYAVQDRLIACALDERPAVQEKAIRVLARCDAGQGVPTLLACLEDARARFAIYGLRKALFAMPPDRALALIVDAPMKKVTVAKEVVRLTGELRAAGAAARLAELAAGPLHRDVRIALLRALWDHLDRELTWAIYEAAVTDKDWIVANRLGDIPADRLTVPLDARLAGLLARVLDRPEPLARIDLLRRAPGLALVDRAGVFLAACRARLASPYDEETTAAMMAVMDRSTEAELSALESTLTALTRDPRAFHVAGHALCGRDIRSRASWFAAAKVLERAAATDPRWAPLAIRAAGVRGRADGLVAAITRAAAATVGASLDVDAAVAAQGALVALSDPEVALALAALVTHPATPARRFAVATLAHASRPGRGWTPDLLAHLELLRADADAAISGAAHRVWPPREDDPT